MSAVERGHAFLGDVQGCADEFESLIERLEGELGSDFKLHCVGDMVNRGPDNLRVLERIRSRIESGRAEYVLGNHEVGLIARYLGVRSSSRGDTVADVLESREAEEWVQWLRGRSVCAAGEIGSQRYIMVHASVHPEWSFEDCQHHARGVEERLGQGDLESCGRFLVESLEIGSERDDLGRLVSCRSLDAANQWSSSEPEAGSSEPWHGVWGRQAHDYGVVYGHWALQGLMVAPGLRGLDTGCVHNAPGRPGSLTAWVPRVDSTSGLFDVPDEAFISEPAHRDHGRLRPSSSS